MTGITPTLQGEIEGKTLGETLHAKDSALKRLSIPLKNIAMMLEDEAFLSLSWMKQCYSIPEVKNFLSEEELQSFVDNTGQFAHNITPNGMDEAGNPTGVKADFYPAFELGLENRDGQLIESKENQFFTVGEHIGIEDLDWEGMITIDPKSIISPTPELERQRKLELFNLIQPVVQIVAETITQDIEMAYDVAKPSIQLLETQNEKPKLWLPDRLVKYMEDPEAYMQEQIAKQEQEMQAQQAQTMQEQEAQSQTTLEQGPPLFIDILDQIIPATLQRLRLMVLEHLIIQQEYWPAVMLLHCVAQIYVQIFLDGTR